MTQPPPYTRGFSFTDFSAASPSAQQPGAKLDAEFDGIKTTTDAIRTNLALIQADDGDLMNDVVRVDSLADETKAYIASHGGGGGGGGGGGPPSHDDVIDALGFTPLDSAGDTVTGPLVLEDGAEAASVDDVALAVAAAVSGIVVPPTVTIPRYQALDGSIPWPWSGLTVGSPSAGIVTDAGFREIWLDWFYQSSSDTDSDALAFFASVQVVYGDCILKFRAGKGRGPSGRYIIDRLIEFSTGQRLILDFGDATVRWTTTASKIKYTGNITSGSSATHPTDYFVVRSTGVFQYAAAVDAMFEWNMTYSASRFGGTGFVEGSPRVTPQDRNNAGHTINAVFRTKNTWYFSVKGGHYYGPQRAFGSIFSGCTLIEQQGVCVVTTIGNATETDYFDTVIEPGVGLMVGVTGTFSSGTYAKGKALRQGANIAYFGRNDGGYGYTYSLYDETGTLTTGTAELLDSLGTVVGSFTIATIGRYYQFSEAIQIDGGSTFIAGNYFINATAPANPDGSTTGKWLNWNFMNMHCAYGEGFIKVNGIAGLFAGAGCYPNAGVAGKTCFDINNGDIIDVIGAQGTTNALGGTWFKGRNITAGHLCLTDTYFYEKVWDLDNTVKSFKVHDNTAYESGITFTNVSTANRYNGSNTRGVSFRGNGLMGVGFDQDDLRKQAWTPVPTASSGSITSYTVASGAGFVLCNGVLTLACKITISNRGTGDGTMYVSLPTLPTGVLFDGHVNASVGNQAVPAEIDAANSRIQLLNASVLNSSNNAFKISNVAGDYVYYFQASLPVTYS